MSFTHKLRMMIKKITILYLFSTFFLFLYTMLEIVDNRVRLKYGVPRATISSLNVRGI